MRLLLIIFLIFGTKFSALGCFCAPFNLCKHLENIEDNETTFIFKGSYIQEESLGNSTTAVQFKIEKVYKGEVVKPDSPFYGDEVYTNTDSTIWILSGSESSCLRYFFEPNAIFVLTYNTGWPSPHNLVGYVPSICYTDYFPISNDQTITGYIYPGNDVTIELAEFEELITNGCSPSATIDQSISNQIEVYPNPTTDVLNIQFNSAEHLWNIILVDKTGKKLGALKGDSIDMSELNPGIYFLLFRNGTTVGAKKIVKI